MKRFFFSLIALSAAAIGCTQSALLETPDLEDAEITFSAYTGRTPVTKAEQIVGESGLASAGGFNVVGYLNEYTNTTKPSLITSSTVYMDDVKVEGDASNGDYVWTPTIAHYWPEENSTSTLSFVAYSYNAVNHIQWDDDKTRDKFTFTVPSTIQSQVDLLATALQHEKNLENTSDATVDLTFHHLLSRIGFQVQTTTNKSVTIKALSLNGRMYTKGLLDLKAVKDDNIPVLNPTGSKSDVEYIYLSDDNTNDDVVVNNANADPVSLNKGYMMILPHIVRQGDDHVISVEYQIGNTEKEAFVELQPDFEFKPGKAYEFILKISTSSIVFSVTEQGWNNTSEESTLEPIPMPDITLGSSVTNINSAEISVTANSITGLSKVGLEYRLKGADAWTAGETKTTGLEVDKPFTLSTSNNLTANTEYEYRVYSETNAGIRTDYPADASYPTFVTKLSVSISDASNVNAFGATFSGSFTNSGVRIVEWGFCWVEGSGMPYKDNSHYYFTEDLTGSFSHTITSCKSGTTYTCRAYVTNEKGVTSYSEAKAFTTTFSVNDEDYAGGGYEDGGSTDFETNE